MGRTLVGDLQTPHIYCQGRCVLEHKVQGQGLQAACGAKAGCAAAAVLRLLLQPGSPEGARPHKHCFVVVVVACG
jgi:hypothetical protein